MAFHGILLCFFKIQYLAPGRFSFESAFHDWGVWGQANVFSEAVSSQKLFFFERRFLGCGDIPSKLFPAIILPPAHRVRSINCFGSLSSQPIDSALDTNTIWHLALGWGRSWSLFYYTKNQCETLSIFNALGLTGAWGLGANLHVLTNLRFLSTCTLSGKIPEVKENVNLHKTCESWKKHVQIGDWRPVRQTEILSYRFYRRLPAWKWLVGNREWRILDTYSSMWHGFLGGHFCRM